MSLQDKVPVEPIAPDRLERLERRVVAAAGPLLARPRRPSLWPVGLALAGAAAGAIAMYALRPAPQVPAPAARPVAVSTDARGATLDIGEAQIAAGPDTRYDLVRAGGGIDVLLDHGAVHLDVEPRENRPPLWVHAGDVGVRVVGTAFTVTRAPGDGEVMVEVEHGTVEVHKAGAVAPVTGGQRWSSRDGSVLAMADNPGGAATGTSDPKGGTRIGATDTHTGALATGPAIDVAVLTDRDRPTITPGAGSGSGSGASRVSPRSGAKPPGAGSGSDSGSSTVVPPDDAGDLQTQIRREPLKAAMLVPDVTTAAERVVALTKIGYSTDPRAGAALYGLARTQHVELGKHADALETLDAYLKRFRSKDAPEHEAVLWLRLRILCRGSFSDECRAAAHTYATDYPSDDPKRRGGIADRIKNSPGPS